MNTYSSFRISSSSSSEEMETERFSMKISTEEILTVKYQQGDPSNSMNSSGRVKSNPGSYLVDYGPIRVRHRRAPSQTLATGRRLKDTPLSPEEAAKRELRRAKNRIAARELKKSRDQIESNLVQQITDLETQKSELNEQLKLLEEYKARLNRAVYNAKQTPLIPLVVDMNFPLLFEPKQGHDVSIDLRPLLDIIDEDFYLSD